MSNPIYEKLQKCVEAVRSKTDFVPDVALVLGSGLGGFAENIKIETEISYSEIPGFPVSTVPGHAGKFIFGYLDNVKVVCMKGRVHFYEGYQISDVVLPARLMKLLGAKILFLTNAAGGLGEGFNAGDLMLITDHISFMIPSPLRGSNVGELGVRFPDMSHVYDPELSDVIRAVGIEQKIGLKEGVYLQTKGPQYETPAEINAARFLGADAVGMSTVCEAIAAHHAGMRVVGVSCISNLAAGISPTPLSEQEVLDAGKMVAKKFTALVTESIKRF